MSIDENALRSLPPDEKMRLVELLWDDLGAVAEPIPLPDWVDQEAARRRDEMRDPNVGLTHDEVWQGINVRDSSDVKGNTNLR